MKYISKDNLQQYDGLIKNYIADKASNIQEILAYGVQWSEDSLDPHLTRIGNMLMHKLLPIQNNIKGVIAQKSKILYYLDENDWRWRREPLYQKLTITDNTIINDIFSTKQYEKQWLRIGTEEVQIVSIDTTTKTATLTKTPTLTGEQSVELGAVLNGYDGTVRVKVPKFYIKACKDGLIRQVWISPTHIDDSWTEQPSVLIDAYISTYLNAVPENMGFLSTLNLKECISVQNSSTYCRGGNNRAALDTKDYLQTDLGKPHTSVDITSYRRNQTGQHILSYFEYKNIFYWLYVIEYANFNCQEDFNEELTKEGFKQGGLGKGITGCSSAQWNLLNQFYPIIPCGYTNNLGNSTGIKTISTYTYKNTTYYVDLSRYYVDTESVTFTKSEHKIIVSEVKKINTKAIYIGWENACGLHTYKIEGLQEGQSITFSSGTFKTEVTTNGEVKINWDSTIQRDRSINFAFKGTCNITLSIVSTSTVEASVTLTNLQIPRWHGIEQPFGDICIILDGILIDSTIINTNQVKMYICKNPEYFSSAITNNYKLLGTTLYKSGWVKSWKFTSEADLLIESVTTSSTTSIGDYYYIESLDTQLRCIFVGGGAHYGADAGLGNFNCTRNINLSVSYIGMRSVSFFSEF